MQIERRKFLKSTGLLLVTATVAGTGVMGLVNRAGSQKFKLSPVPGEFYGRGLSDMMKRERFVTPAAALRAVRNQNVRFVIEFAA
jgi:hypothetical protein